MQSDGNSFCRDVVLAYRDDYSILEPNYEKQISFDLYYEVFESYQLLNKMHILRSKAHSSKEPITLGFSAILMLLCISV